MGEILLNMFLYKEGKFEVNDDVSLFGNVFTLGTKKVKLESNNLGITSLIYAPNVHVELDKGSFEGIVISNSFETDDDATLTYKSIDLSNNPIFGDGNSG